MTAEETGASVSEWSVARVTVEEMGTSVSVEYGKSDHGGDRQRCRVDINVCKPPCEERAQGHFCVSISFRGNSGDHHRGLAQMGSWEMRRISACVGSLTFKRLKLIKN